MNGLKIVFLVICILALMICNQAESKDFNGLLKQARQAYDQGDYNQAVKHYQLLLEEGYDDAELYYNLGNAAFKAGQLGEAIAFYRQAQKRATWDEDIQYNLNYARSRVNQPGDKSGPLEKIFKDLFMRLSGSVLLVTVWILYIVLFILLGIMILKRYPGSGLRWLVAGLGIVFFFTAIVTSIRIVVEKNIRWGVIVADQAEARNGPGMDNQVGFTVPEGREVRVLGRDGEWMAIGLSKEGFKGWIKSDEIWEE